MFGLRIKKRFINFVIRKYNPDLLSFSQAGEDSILNFLFNDVKIKFPQYLDIGANYPDLGNNTYKFYVKGSRGVLVEADETLIPLIKEKRPKDIVLNCGVSVKTKGIQDFYVFNINGLNTFDKEEALNREKNSNYNIVKVVKVPLININEIIDEYFMKFPDLLSIDIEGMDLDVLKSLNYDKYPIPVICVETCKYSETNIRPKDSNILDYLISIGYFVYADTYINTIFVRENWFKERAQL
jgi:FkbM family methyltransferase